MIDLTPKWTELYPMYANWITDGTPSQKKLVCDELMKLCKLADAVNDAKKAGTLNGIVVK